MDRSLHGTGRRRPEPTRTRPNLPSRTAGGEGGGSGLAHRGPQVTLPRGGAGSPGRQLCKKPGSVEGQSATRQTIGPSSCRGVPRPGAGVRASVSFFRGASAQP